MVVAVYGAAKQKTAFARDLLIHSRRIATRHPPTIHLPLRWMDMDAPVVDICMYSGEGRVGQNRVVYCTHLYSTLYSVPTVYIGITRPDRLSLVSAVMQVHACLHRVIENAHGLPFFFFFSPRRLAALSLSQAHARCYLKHLQPQPTTPPTNKSNTWYMNRIETPRHSLPTDDMICTWNECGSSQV